MKKLSILLVVAMLLSVLTVSLGSCKKKTSTNTPSEEGTTTKKVVANSGDDDEYNIEPEDLGGFELDILATKSNTWNMNTDLAPESLTGDRINQAVYSRNQMVEGLYNARIIAHEDVDYYKGTERLIADQMAGDNRYDAAYVEGSSVKSAITQGCTKNLYSVSELQLDKVWWSQLVKDEATLGSGKYATLNFMQSNLSLTAFDLTWCVYFNKSLQESYQLDSFYDMVRDDEWTLEAMQTAATEVKTLNDDDSFEYRADGHSIYGITSYWNGAKALLNGCDSQFITYNDEDELVPNIQTERFLNMTHDLAVLLRTEGVFTVGGPNESTENTFGNADDYKKIFNAGRALFCIAEVKSSVKDFKTFEGIFGIVPLPKYNDLQDGYRSWVNYLAPVLVIPSSCTGTTLHKTGVLLDVLSYYSQRDVLPDYYDVVLKGRGAKDQESTEMLDYINESKSFDASIAYGWTNQFVEHLSSLLLNGVTDVSGMVATYIDPITQLIEETMNAVFEN